MSADEFAHCVQTDDTNALVKLPGIGKKTAERLIIEMRARLDKLEIVSNSVSTAPAGGDGSADSPLANRVTDPVADAVSALIALGYKPNEASRMVRQIDSTGLGSEEIIRAALQGVTQ